MKIRLEVEQFHQANEIIHLLVLVVQNNVDFTAKPSISWGFKGKFKFFRRKMITIRDKCDVCPPAIIIVRNYLNTPSLELCLDARN